MRIFLVSSPKTHVHTFARISFGDVVKHCPAQPVFADLINNSDFFFFHEAVESDVLVFGDVAEDFLFKTRG